MVGQRHTNVGKQNLQANYDRYAMPFLAVSLVLLMLATVFAFLGHCSEDHRTLVAVGLYIMGGLSLGGSLVVFVSVLSDAYLECPQKPTAFVGFIFPTNTSPSSPFDYHYGWSFFAAGCAVLLAEVAGLLSITAFFRRLPVLEDVVRIVVPSSDCPARELGYFAGQRSHQLTRLLNGPASIVRTNDAAEVKPASPSKDVLESVVAGPLMLSNAEPDICRSNPARVAKVHVDTKSPGEDWSAASPRIRKEVTPLPSDSTGSWHGFSSKAPERTPPVVGVTVPIKLMKPNTQILVRPIGTVDKALPQTTASFLYGEHVNVFATLPRGSCAAQKTAHRTSDDSVVGSSVSAVYSTMQPHRGKNVTISTFSAVNTFEISKGNAWTNSEV